MDTEQHLGAVRIARQVLATIIEMTALKVPGVVRLASVGGHLPRFRDREASFHGMALTMTEQNVSANLYLVVAAGSNMVQVAT
ncbi:MAG TPA: Asp23/Gls24 family envelope stress response protein, partial [Ktedonobacterales bacterium]|nr:Asp23/Gls24 family envelope stress response protein [Ktedonobacterales bacterium]